MSARIEDYAIIGDGETAALVSRAGSIDWLCWPRFDSPACFAALLGTEKHGRWLIEPVEKSSSRREYRADTLILETTFETRTGVAKIIDFMPPRGSASDVVRVVRGISGRVQFRSELLIRFDYGSIVPWISESADITTELHAVAGPDKLTLRTPIALHAEQDATVGTLWVAAGERSAIRADLFAIASAVSPTCRCQYRTCRDRKVLARVVRADVDSRAHGVKLSCAP